MGAETPEVRLSGSFFFDILVPVQIGPFLKRAPMDTLKVSLITQVEDALTSNLII